MAKHVGRAYETVHEIRARLIFALKAKANPKHYRVIRKPELGVWYDFADPETQAYGQCRLNADGTWHQAPSGEDPVFLVHRPARKNGPTMKEEWEAIGSIALAVHKIHVPWRKGDLSRSRLVHRIAKDGVFAGTIKVSKAHGDELRYDAVLSGLSERNMKRLAVYLGKLK